MDKGKTTDVCVKYLFDFKENRNMWMCQMGKEIVGIKKKKISIYHHPYMYLHLFHETRTANILSNSLKKRLRLVRQVE